MKSVPAISFEYRASRCLLGATALVFVLALASIAVCGLTIWIRLACAAAISAYLLRSMPEMVRPPFVRATWHSSGHWRLRDREHCEVTAQLREATVLGPLIVLALRIGTKRNISLVLLPDNCHADVQRQLRVRLARANAIQST